MSKGFIHSTQTTGTDPDGQVRMSTTEKEFTYKTQEDEFYMIFINFVKWVYGIKSLSAIRTLLKLLEIAQFNTGEVSLSAGLRKQIQKELNISPSMLSKAIDELTSNRAIFIKTIPVVDKDGVIQQDKNGNDIVETIKGEYIINPDMFWKGELKKRKELKIIFQSKEDDVNYNDGVQSFEDSKIF